MDDEKKAAQQTDATEVTGDGQTADTKGETKPEQTETAEQKKPAPKKQASAETVQAADEKPPAKPDADDGSSLREENARLQEQVLRLQAEAAVTRLAQSYGVDPKAIPYVSKLIDITGAVKDGKCDDESLKAQIDKILQDLPQLKAAEADGSVKVTSIGVAKDAQADTQSSSKATLATKKWNRFNN